MREQDSSVRAPDLLADKRVPRQRVRNCVERVALQEFLTSDTLQCLIEGVAIDDSVSLQERNWQRHHLAALGVVDQAERAQPPQRVSESSSARLNAHLAGHFDCRARRG